MIRKGQSFYVTGGTISSDAPCYVERQADQEVYRALLEGEFCYVLTSRQMGKSSLAVRTASRLRAQGIDVAALDLSAIGQNLTAEQWYNGLLTSLGDQLGMEDRLEQFWAANQHLGPLQRWFLAIRKVVLTSGQTPLVIFLDEIDSVLSLPFSTDEFFAAIRESYNRRSEDPDARRLTFCLMGVAIPSDLIRDTRMTPFNIGRRIELHDFTDQEATPLGFGLHRDRNRTMTLLRRVLFWTGGHPYLTQRLCHALANRVRAVHRGEVDQACEELFFAVRARERDDNLIFVRERLLRSSTDLTGLLNLYLKVHSGRRVADDETNPMVSVLRLSGIVRSAGGALAKRNRIYHRVFDRQWVQANLPDAELRRQKAAYRLGVLRTAGISATVVIAMAVMLFITVSNTKNAYVAQANATLVSGHQGQRHDTLSAIAKANWILSDKSKLRNLAVKSLTLMDLSGERILKGPEIGALTFAMSPDFGFSAEGDSQGTVTVRSSTNGNELVRLQASRLPVTQLGFSPNGRYLAAAHEKGTNGEIAVFDWSGRSAILVIPGRINSKALEFSPDNRRLGCSEPDGRLVVYSLDGPSLNPAPPLTSTNALDHPANCIRFHPTANKLAQSSDASLYVRIWNLDTGQIERLYHPGPVFDLAWHPDGESLAAACQSGEIYLWDLRFSSSNGDLSLPATHRVLGKHDGEVHQVEFNHEGTLLASAGTDRIVRLWSPFTGRQMTHPLATDEKLEALVFSADDEHLGLRRNGTAIGFWDVDPAREYRVLLGHVGPSEQIETVDFSPDDKWLAAASNDGIVIWDASTGKKLAVKSDEASISTHSAFFDPISGDLLASSSLKGWRRFRSEVRPFVEPFAVRDITNSARLYQELGPFVLSNDGKTCAVLHDNNEIYVFDPNQPSAPPIILTGTDHFQSLAISSDGHYLAAGIAAENEAQTNRIQIWDLTKRTRVEGIPPLDSKSDFAFSPSGGWFVTTTADAVHFWKVGSWQPGPAYSGLTGPIAFSADGKLLAMTDSSSAIELVRVSDRASVVRLENPDRKRVRGLTFSHNNKKLAAVSSEQLVLLWDLELIAQNLARLDLASDLPFTPKGSTYASKAISGSATRF